MRRVKRRSVISSKRAPSYCLSNLLQAFHFQEISENQEK